MEKDFRHNMQHLGDIVVDKLEKVFGSLKISTRGIVQTYEIHELEKKRRNILTRIGKRLGEVRKQSPEKAIFNDEDIMKLFSTLTTVEERLEKCQQEREARLYPRDFASEQYET